MCVVSGFFTLRLSPPPQSPLSSTALLTPLSPTAQRRRRRRRKGFFSLTRKGGEKNSRSFYAGTGGGRWRQRQRMNGSSVIFCRCTVRGWLPPLIWSWPTYHCTLLLVWGKWENTMCQNAPKCSGFFFVSIKVPTHLILLPPPIDFNQEKGGPQKLCQTLPLPLL